MVTSTAALLLVALGGLAAALWAQARGFGLDPAEFRQRQSKLALRLLGLLTGLGLLQAAHETRFFQRLTAPEVDGAWTALSIDGRPVSRGEWRVGVTDGSVAGGRDGCNEWGFEAPKAGGAGGMIVSTLVGCPEGDPTRKAYWALALADPVSLRLGEDGLLRLAGSGHEAVLRRCRRAGAPSPPGTSGSRMQDCAAD